MSADLVVTTGRKLGGSSRLFSVVSRCRRFFQLGVARVMLLLSLVISLMLINSVELSAQTIPSEIRENGSTSGGKTTGRTGGKRKNRRNRATVNNNGSRNPGPSKAIKIPPDGLYRVRLLLRDEDGGTVEEAEITSSIGGEELKVKAGGIYVIPAATVPQDRWVTIIAEKRNAFMRGEVRTQLISDANPSLTITLLPDRSASISGIVMDENRGPVEGAKVSVGDHPEEEITTGSNGRFKLAAHKAKKQEVMLYVQRDGFESWSDWQMAGDTPIEVTLKRKKP